MQLKSRAKISNWKVIPQPGGEGNGRMILIGEITDHPNPEVNGCGVTSPVLWYSNLFHMAETQNTVYDLGTPNPGWVEELATQGKKVEDFEPLMH